MDRILSKEEIAELLSAVRGGEVGIEAELDRPPAKQKVERLDLFHPQWAAGWRAENFDDILDTFARQSALYLTSLLQQAVTVKRQGLDALDFATLLPQQKNAAIGVVALEPLKNGGLLVFDAPLSFSLVEIILGGAADAPALVMERNMTGIEVNIIKKVMAGNCAGLQKAFEPLEKVTASLRQVEIDPRKIKIFASDTALLLAKFAVAIGGKAGLMSLAIPYAALEPFKAKLIGDRPAGRPASPDNWSRSLLATLQELETEVVALSGEVSLQIKDIFNLRVGDVIDLNYNPNSPLRIVVEQQPVFFASAGVRNGKKAVRIIRKIKQGENHGRK